MSDDTEADIVLQLDALATYAERANHWTDDRRLMDAAGVADTVFGAIHHIEELEAKLAKAVDALMFYADPTYNGYDVCIGDYGLSVNKGCIIQDDGDLARATLAELKGQNDE